MTPKAIQGYIRFGCLHLSVDVTVADPEEAAAAAGRLPEGFANSVTSGELCLPWCTNPTTGERWVGGSGGSEGKEQGRDGGEGRGHGGERRAGVAFFVTGAMKVWSARGMEATCVETWGRERRSEHARGDWEAPMTALDPWHGMERDPSNRAARHCRCDFTGYFPNSVTVAASGIVIRSAPHSPSRPSIVKVKDIAVSDGAVRVAGTGLSHPCTKLLCRLNGEFYEMPLEALEVADEATGLYVACARCRPPRPPPPCPLLLAPAPPSSQLFSLQPVAAFAAQGPERS